MACAFHPIACFGHKQSSCRTASPPHHVPKLCISIPTPPATSLSRTIMHHKPLHKLVNSLKSPVQEKRTIVTS
ncbi:uncharacterized [Tachysurus ichikawai]